MRVFVFFIMMLLSSFAFSEDDALETYRLGRELEGKNRMEDANVFYTEAVQLCMNEISSGIATMDTYAVLTWTFQRQRKYSDVIRYGRQALNIRSDNRIIETMGEAYFYNGNYDLSLSSMQRYISNLPEGDRAPVAYFFMGEIFKLQSKFNYADIAYTAALRLEPNMALWWYRLGLVRESAGQLNYAAEAYEGALKINPSYSNAVEALARVRKSA
jgi:tetratricopeptide (TPR) repeat protein